MIRKLATVGAIVTGVVMLVAGPAFAHVEIERDGEASAAGVVDATLSVPNEETTAGTTKIELVFPASPSLKNVAAGAVNGWTATVQKNAADEVTAVTWTGGPLTGEDEVDLPLSIGDVPEDVDVVDFKAVQTYDNGTTVRWIDPTPPGGEEPEHPAPVLSVRGDADGHDDGESHDESAGSDSDSHEDDSTGVTIAITVGIVVVLAILALVLSRVRRDKRSKQD